MIKIKKFSKNNYATWDSFVLEANNGTLFHLRKFLSYHPRNRFKDHSVEIYKKNTLLSVFPAVDIIIDNKRVLASHPGASYGSFTSKKELSIKDAMLMVSKLIDYSRNNGFEGIQLTIPPVFYSQRLSNYIEYSLLFNGFDYLKRDVTSILAIENSEDQILNKFKPSHQRALRKSKKLGVTTRITERVDEFYSILKNNLKIRHGVDPTHSLTELKSLIKLFPDSINIFGAFYDQQMIAGVLNIIVKEGVALAFYISHKEDFQELRPLNLLFFDIFNWGLKNNIKVYDFGTFTDNGVPNMGLGRFKESFGASGVFRDSFKILF